MNFLEALTVGVAFATAVGVMLGSLAWITTIGLEKFGAFFAGTATVMLWVVIVTTLSWLGPLVT